MSDGRERVYLRSNAIIEPLVDRFYAWLHNVAPVQASLNLANVHVPLLESYLHSPQVHVAAGENPDLRGGYFVHVAEERAAEISELLNGIKRDRADMLAFAAAIADADELIRQNATGFDISPLYAKLAPALHGLVELAYDTGHQASLRLIEPLLYHSPVYDRSRQSVQLSLDPGVERPFILATPRLPSPDALDLPIPFDHPGLDALFRARTEGTTAAALHEALELDGAQAAWLDRLLTPEPGLAPDRHIDGGGRIRYFGHACLVLQTANAAVVVDPFISTDNSHGDRYTLDDLPDHIDLVLITHGHQDHIVLETLLQLRGRTDAVVVPRSSRGNLSDPSIGLYLRALGFTVIEVDDFDEVPLPDGGRIIATPFLGEHCDLDIRSKSTYFAKMAGKSVFIAADSSGIDPVIYQYIRAHLGDVDMAFIGMECEGAPLTWLYKGLLTRPATKKMSDSRRLSGSDARQAASIMTELDASEAYVYAMGEESWQGHVMATTYTPDTYQMTQIEEFLTWCKEHDIPSAHLFNKDEWRW